MNILFINRGKNVYEDEIAPGLNAHRVFRNSHKTVAIISETLLVDKPHIVVAVDSSEPSAIALKSAIIHAKKINAQLSVISVYEPTSITSAKMISMGLDEKSENERHFRIFKEEFNDFIEDFDFDGLEYKTVLLKGIPHEEIISFAKIATILYIGSTGKSGLRRVVLGSVTEKVISRMSCNIVAMKSEKLFKLKIPTDLLDIENL